MSDLPPHFRVALAVVKAWPDRRKIEEIILQSEQSTEDMLFWTIGFASFLAGLIARAEGATKEATLAKIARGMAKWKDGGWPAGV